RLAPDLLQPDFLVVSNTYEGSACTRRNALSEGFCALERRLKDDEAYVARVFGQPLPPGRGKYLDRLFRILLKRNTAPAYAMHAFAKEIRNTSLSHHNVGDKVLAFCIPRMAAARTYQTGGHLMLAMEPDLETTAFCFLDPMYRELNQYGPKFVCGDAAITNVKTESDASRDFQSSEFKILHMPKRA